MTLTKVTRTATVITLILLAWAVIAHSQTSAQERADTLRMQLEDVKTKQLDLQSRLQVLEEQSKPENIEKSLAGIGSTKPEDLRELKRRQLESEKLTIQKQLALLAESQTRLETSIARANADAYHQSAARDPAVAEPVGAGKQAAHEVTPPRRHQRVKNSNSKHAMVRLIQRVY